MTNYKILIELSDSVEEYYDYKIVGDIFHVIYSLEDGNRYLKVPLIDEEPLYYNKSHIVSVQIQKWYKPAKRG